jgi:hypothetical protein
MSRHATITSRSDTDRPMPLSRARRLDEAHAALASLREEERRLERLGLEGALRGCREQLRYWEFLAALFALEPMSPACGSGAGSALRAWTPRAGARPASRGH